MECSEAGEMARRQDLRTNCLSSNRMYWIVGLWQNGKRRVTGTCFRFLIEGVDSKVWAV